MPVMPALPDEFDRNAVIAIQGGGIYGLGLLGQLAEVVERQRIEPLALAGTSAGAIIATLYWAGLAPREIRGRFLGLAAAEAGSAPAGPETLTDLLGPFEPGRRPFDFARFQALAGRFAAIRRLLGGGPPAGSGRLRRAMSGAARGLAASRHAAAILAAVGPHWSRRGLFRGDRLEAAIDGWIRSSPRLARYRDALPGRPLTFGMIRDLQRDHPEDRALYYPPLILTATNVTSRKLALINSFDDEFAGVPIARAVRASAGFPAFFRPVDLGAGIEPGWYVDGGVIANFPAWVFSAEFRQKMREVRVYRGLAGRPWINIGLREVDDRPVGGPAGAGPAGFFAGLAGLLAGQGRNELERALSERLPRSITIEQPESETSAPGHFLDVAQLTDSRIRAMFSRGQEYAEAALESLSFALPRGAAGRGIDAALRGLVRRAERLFGSVDAGPPRFRCNIFMPARDRLVLRYGHGMARDEDRLIRFRYDSGLTGYCFRDRRPWVCNLATLREVVEAGTAGPIFGMGPEEHRKVRPDRTWLLSVPIFDPLDSGPTVADGRGPSVDPAATYFASQVPRRAEGAAFGVLNLDAAFAYGVIAADTQKMLTDPVVQTTIYLAEATAREVGLILSDAFASRK